MSEIASHLTSEQERETVFNKYVGSYSYLVENHFNGVYRVIGKEPISGKMTQIMKEILNDD